MPKSFRSVDDDVGGDVDADEDSYAAFRAGGSDDEHDGTRESQTPQSPLWTRRRVRPHFADERSSLLDHPDNTRTYQTRNISTPGTPRTLRTPGIRRQHSHVGSFRHHARRGSSGHGFSTRLVNALMREGNDDMDASGM